MYCQRVRMKVNVLSESEDEGECTVREWELNSVLCCDPLLESGE